MIKIKLFHILCTIIVLLLISCAPVGKKVNDDSIGFIWIPKANCIICKEQLSNLLESNKGITSFEIHINEKIILLSYNYKKTGMDDIHQLIASYGHKTDKFDPNPAALVNLPDCCK